MKKDETDFEQRLLSHASLDELIKIKMEQELQEEIQRAKKEPEIKIQTDIKKVSPDLIFSKKSLYKIFNRTNKSETFINGIQAEAMLGLQTTIREKLLSGQLDAFSTTEAYVKFVSVEM